MLVHFELINKTPGGIRGCVRCGDRRCRVCDFLGAGTDFKINVTDKNFVINFNLNCNSDHVVYLLSCARCAIQYVGSTITKFWTRFNNHKSRLNAHRRLSAENKLRDEPVYRHFYQPDHQDLNDVRVQRNLVKFRKRNHKLMIELGRYRVHHVTRENRLCPLCESK